MDVENARNRLEGHVDDRQAAQDEAKRMVVKAQDVEHRAQSAAENMHQTAEALRQIELATTRAETLCQVAVDARDAALQIASTLKESEQTASLQARLDNEAAVAAEKIATQKASAAAEMQRETLKNALMVSASKGNKSALEQLLHSGVDGVKPHIDVADSDGETALTKAADNDHEQIVDLLLQLGADPRNLPVRLWTYEQVLRWCKSEFRWFSKYCQSFAAALIDGEALLE